MIKCMIFIVNFLRSIDDVQKIVDDLAEHNAVNDEILSVISTPVNNDLDEDDLLKELEELEVCSKFFVNVLLMFIVFTISCLRTN